MKAIQLILFICISLLSTSSYADATNFTPTQQTQIQSIVRDYLLNNPQILVEMAQRLQQDKVQQAVSSNIKPLFFAETSPVAGNSKADVTVVEFLDYQCPHCKHVAPFVNQLLSNDSNVRVIYKGLPVFGEVSEYAIRAALAAQQQGKFTAIHDALLKANAPFTKQQILDIAKSAGLDIAKLKTDMSLPIIDQELKNNEQLAATFNLPGTPAFIITVTPASSSAKPGKVFLVPGDTDFSTLKRRVNAVETKAQNP